MVLKECVNTTTVPYCRPTIIQSMSKSNKFDWETYDLPRWSEEDGVVAEADDDTEDVDVVVVPEQKQSVTLRHLKQGRTGAVRTWPAAKVLLDYLVLHGGLRDVRDKIPTSTSTTTPDVLKEGSSTAAGAPSLLTLDLTVDPPENLCSNNTTTTTTTCQNNNTSSPPCYNIVELGAGSGFLGVGLASAMNREAYRNKVTTTTGTKTPFIQPRVRVMCTDNDPSTIKNMRFNVSQQPRATGVSKTVRVENLGWDDNVGGAKFSKAVEAQFRQKTKTKKTVVVAKEKSGDVVTKREEVTSGASVIDSGFTNSDAGYPTCAASKHVVSAEMGHQQSDPTTADAAAENSNEEEDEDPIRLLTHIIASDVLYGENTLDPLSSVISALKLRNPSIIVTMLIRERTSGSVADLKSSIESKVRYGLLHSLEQGGAQQSDLEGFSVSVRDVLHKEVLNMKMIEC